MENVIVRGKFRKPNYVNGWGTFEPEEYLQSFKDLVYEVIKNRRGIDEDDFVDLYNFFTEHGGEFEGYEGHWIIYCMNENERNNFSNISPKEFSEILKNPKTEFNTSDLYFFICKNKDGTYVESGDNPYAFFEGYIEELTDWIAENEDLLYQNDYLGIETIKDLFDYERLRYQGRAGSFFMENGEVKSEWKKSI